MLYPFQWLKNRKCDFRWIFLSNLSDGGPVFIFERGSRKEKLTYWYSYSVWGYDYWHFYFSSSTLKCWIRYKDIWPILSGTGVRDRIIIFITSTLLDNKENSTKQNKGFGFAGLFNFPNWCRWSLFKSILGWEI
jgi:hypothetical protein